MYPLQRYLDVVETSLINKAAAHIMECRGLLEPEAMVRAYRLLAARYPLLRACIVDDGHGNLLSVDPGAQPNVSVCMDYEGALDDVLSKPWELSSGVSRLDIIVGEGRGLIVHRLDHGVSDGPSRAAMTRDLWSLYTEIVDRHDPRVEPGKMLPRAPYELYMERWGARPVSVEASQLPRVSGKAIYRRIQLDFDETLMLVSAARSSETTVYAIVCGSILVGLRNHGMSIADPAPMMCLSGIGLRNRVKPRVGATETTTFVTRHAGRISVAANANPIAVGRKLKAQLNDAVARRDLMPMDRFLILPPPPATFLETRLAMVLVSSGDAIDVRCPGSLTIENMSMAFPSYGEGGPPIPVCGLYTRNGRFNMYCAFPSAYFCEDEVAEIASRTESILRNVCI